MNRLLQGVILVSIMIYGLEVHADPNGRWSSVGMACVAQDNVGTHQNAGGAVAATLGAQDDPDAVQLPGFVVQHKRSITNLLPCLGCTGRPKVPMHLLLDLADSVNSLFVVPVAKRPDDPADGSRQWAHFYMCLPDNPLGCAQSPQDP